MVVLPFPFQSEKTREIEEVTFTEKIVLVVIVKLLFV